MPTHPLLSATTGTVRDNTLTYQQDGREATLLVDSAAWHRWLENATSFTFHSAEGTFTAHKERASNRRGGWYWRAYRQRQGRLFRFYLGLSVKVTLERLHAAASYLEQPAREQPSRRGAGYGRADALPSPNGTSIIMTTRLQIPRLPLQHVPRSQVVALLEESVQRPLTLVSAPAGSGKTTLLAEWASTTTMPLAWFSLEAADNDPARFLSYLVTALSSLDERIDRSSLSVRQHDHESVLTALLNDLAQLLQRDTALILDDYHLITSKAAQDALLFLLEHLPARLHLLIGTRVDPPLPLARLRARNQLSELRAPELRFASQEVEAFVRAMGLLLPHEATNLLEQRTEGWIAGIQLLSLILRGRDDALAFLRAFRGNHHFFVDYVLEEILAQQPPAAQRFLLQTSILERLTGPLCDAVTRQTGGQAALAAFVRGNLFVSALDDTATWYRYHPLFAESLRSHLLKQEPELLPELYRRASCWYEQQGDEEEACEYAFLAGDLPHAATLLAELVPHLIEQGKFRRMLQWLSQLTPVLINDSPALSVASLWTYCRSGSTQQIIEQFEQQFQKYIHHNAEYWIDMQRELTVVQAWAALYRDDIPRTINLVRETLRSLSHPNNAHFRSDRLSEASSEGALSVGTRALRQLIALRLRIVLGTAYRAAGDLEAAERVLLETLYTGTNNSVHPLNLFANISLADLYEARGRLRAIECLYREMGQALDQLNHPSPLFIALAQVRSAALFYEWNRLEDAESAAQRALALAHDLDFPDPFLVLQSLRVLVRVALARGDSEHARELLTRVNHDLKGRQATNQMPLLQGAIPAYSIPARLALATGQLERAEDWERMQDIHIDDPIKSLFSSWDYFDYVTLARLLLARGRARRNATELAQALSLLERLQHAIEHQGYTGWSIEIQMLTALVLQASGKIKRALTTLGSVLPQAEAEGYVRLFADEGQPMADLLAQIAAFTSASASYFQRLLAAIPSARTAPVDATSGTQHQPLLDPLSTREQEVLRLLAAGSSNRQIAEQLVISLHTVKLHVKHIFAKLSVINRTQAVARARDLHLL